MRDAISDLKAKCSASQNSLDSSNKELGILKHKYKTLKESVFHSKLQLVKEIRQDQLIVTKDSHNNDIVLGQGRSGVCKLMSLLLSGEWVKVAVKQYSALTSREAVVDEAHLLSCISHNAFPFVFGVVYRELHNMLLLEVCGMTEGIEHSVTVYKALQLESTYVSETSWLHVLMLCCEGVHYLHSTEINLHNEFKGDNASERSRLKSCHERIDPALYDGEYAPCPASNVFSFGYMARKIPKTTRSELIEKLFLTCMSKYKRPTFDILLGDLKDILTL